MNGYAVNAETPLELLTDYVTPNELFFVRSHWIPRTPGPKKWRLTIDGEVDRSTQLTLSELKKLPHAEATCVLQCAGKGPRTLRTDASRSAVGATARASSATDYTAIATVCCPRNIASVSALSRTHSV